MAYKKVADVKKELIEIFRVFGIISDHVGDYVEVSRPRGLYGFTVNVNCKKVTIKSGYSKVIYDGAFDAEDIDEALYYFFHSV